MSQKLIISVSGLRGIVGQNLTPAVASEFAAAFGTYLKQKNNDQALTVCLGRDSRPSGKMIASAVQAGLASVGIDAIDLGLVTTPSVGIMVTHLKAAGGIVITASHNPVPYNGIKLLLDTGLAPPPDEAGRIKAIFENKSFDYADSTNCGRLSASDQADGVHIDKVLNIIDKDAIAKRRFKVVIDSVNGAGCIVTKKLLAELGCEIVPVNDEPTGIFAHTPEPTAENLAGLTELVKRHKADVGFGQDPDADRLAIVDDKGRYIGEEYTLALAAKHMFAHKSGTAAANLSTSRMIDDIASAAGGKVIRTPVGEANVASAMIENESIIGGEGNGGVIDLRVGPVRDSLAAIALVLELMAETDRKISELADEIPAYSMIKDKFTAEPDQARKLLETAKERFADAALNASDGYRFDFDDGWIHLRTSNTEPVMRMIVEAKDDKTAAEYAEKVKDIRQLAGC